MRFKKFKDYALEKYSQLMENFEFALRAHHIDLHKEIEQVRKEIKELKDLMEKKYP